MKGLKDIEVSGKKVLLRCDFNVPLNDQMMVLDDFKIKMTLPTIQYLLNKGSKIVIMTHLDPKNSKVVEKRFNVNAIAQKLSDFLDIAIKKSDSVIGPGAENDCNNLKEGEVLMLENLRFYKEETDNDPAFAKKLSYLGEIFINDAFAVCHRNNASVTFLPKLLPHVAGLLLEKEISSLDKIIKNPERPLVSIIGGKKLETKSKLIDAISQLSDFVIVSGLIKQDMMERNMKVANQEKIIAPEKDLGAPDIDEETTKKFSTTIKKAKTVFWNGPFGKFEDEQYQKGTLEIARAIIDSHAFSVAGGGDTVAFLAKNNMIDKFNHVSTGGGAMISYLAGESMPGLEALK